MRDLSTYICVCICKAPGVQQTNRDVCSKQISKARKLRIGLLVLTPTPHRRHTDAIPTPYRRHIYITLHIPVLYICTDADIFHASIIFEKIKEINKMINKCYYLLEIISLID